MNESRISSSISRGRTRSRLVGMTIVGWPPVPRSARPGRFGSQCAVMMVDTRCGEEGSGNLRLCSPRIRQSARLLREAAGYGARMGRAGGGSAADPGPGVGPAGGPVRPALRRRLLVAEQRRDAGALLLGGAALAVRDAGEHLLQRGGVAQAGVAALAALEVGTDLVGAPRCELAVQVLEDAGERLAAVDLTHGWPGRTYPSSTAYAYSSFCNRRRPWNSPR